METCVIKVTELIYEVKIDLRGPQQPQRLYLDELKEQFLKATKISPICFPPWSVLECFIISKANSRLGFITIAARRALGTFPSCYSILLCCSHLLISQTWTLTTMLISNFSQLICPVSPEKW